MKKSKNIYEEKGFIQLPKTVLDWEWYGDSNVTRLFIHILLKANFKPKKWNGIKVGTGELITSLDKLKIELNLSLQNIRTALRKLKQSGYILTKPTNKYTHIKLLESEVYSAIKELNKQANKKHTPRQHSNNSQLTTTNKEKKEKELKERKEIFKNKIFEFKNQFSNENLIRFFNYWSEECKQTGRMKFEDQSHWNLRSRLENWTDFSNKYKKTLKFNKNR